MSEGTVRQWCTMFQDGWTNVCYEARMKWLAIRSEWLSCSKCWPENWKMALHNFRTSVWTSTNFTHCSFQEDYHSHAGLSQVLHKMGSRNAHRCTQNAVNGCSFCRLF
jgi:hypothetical protein